MDDNVENAAIETSITTKESFVGERIHSDDVVESKPHLKNADSFEEPMEVAVSSPEVDASSVINSMENNDENAQSEITTKGVKDTNNTTEKVDSDKRSEPLDKDDLSTETQQDKGKGNIDNIDACENVKENFMILKTETKDDTEKIVSDVKETGASKSTDSTAKSALDVSLKHLANRYTCIGTAQLVPKSGATTGAATNNVATTSSKPKKSSSELKTVKFVIRNVTKSSKISKVSNLDYRIKPVRKYLTVKNKKNQFPIVYVGEPAFIDADDFSECAILDSHKTSPELLKIISSLSEVKEESLYDLSSLKNAFIPENDCASIKTKLRKFIFPTADPLQPTFVRQSSIPFPHSQPTVKHKAGFNMPQNFVINSSLPNMNGMVRIVARTIPSATLASSTFTVSKSNITTYKKVFPVKNVKSLYSNFHQSNGVKPKSVSSPALQSKSMNMPVPVITPPVTISTKPLPTLKPISSLKPITSKVPVTVTLSNHQNILRVKILPNKNTAVSEKASPKAGGSKTSMPIQLISTIPSHTKVITVSAGGSGGMVNGKPTTAVFVPSKKGVQCFSSVPKMQQRPASEVLAQIVNTHKADINSNNVESDLQATSVKFGSKGLREGVEVTFEDGVRHFITSLRQITYLDDEQIKSWHELKKGMKVAAKWKDGLIYDATIVSCYFSTEKKNITMLPVVKLQKIPGKSLTKIADSKTTQKTTIACTKCRTVFQSLLIFRKHQKRVCKSQGITVRNGTTEITDEILQAANKDKDNVKNIKETKTEIEKQVATKRKISSPTSTEKNVEKPARKKIKVSTTAINNERSKNVYERTKQLLSTKTSPSDPNFLFKKGTHFLHRWQLDDGGSKWYQGEVVKIVSTPKSTLDCEFEVSYRGEEENYVLKLYEDYPSDIRIMGDTS